jgi:hypothetical protein
MRDPLWMEGDDIARGLVGEDEEEYEDDPDRLHDQQFEEE